MEDLIRGLIILIVGNLLLVPFCLSVGALFPRRVARTRALAESLTGRSVVIGLVNLLFLSGLALAFSALADAAGNELPRLPALLIVSVLFIALAFALTAVAQLVGARLRPNDASVWQNIWGTLALSLGSALPLLGWFALLPYIACLGLGAFILSFFVREPVMGNERKQGN